MLKPQLTLPYFLPLLFSLATQANAHTTTLAVTGAAAVGNSGEVWDQLDSVTLNNAGSVAFAGRLQHSGMIDSSNDAGVWLLGDEGDHLLAQTGSGGVAGIVGADYAEFDRPLLSDTSEVFFTGLLTSGSAGVTSSNDEGFWRFGSATSSLEFRSGSGGVPDMGTADFARVPRFLGTTNIAVAGNGDYSFFNDMQFGVGGVNSINDRGLWNYTASASDLLAREGVLDVPDISSASFATFTTPRMNANGQLAVRAVIKTGGSISSHNDDGVWQFTGTTGTLIAREGVGDVPGYPSRSFENLGWPRMNRTGQVALAAIVDDTANTQGIWLYDGGAGELVVSSDSVVHSVPGAAYSDLNLNGINEAGQILASGSLEVGTGNVTEDDREGLWILNEQESLVARSGSGNVPGVVGASFDSFTNSTLNELGQVAFAADLQSGGDVDASNSSGIWIVDPSGSSWLVARQGDQLAGRTISSLAFLSDEDEDRGMGFNDIGELAFQAGFTNGDSGLFLFRPYRADFDRDGSVDETDLALWEDDYAISPTADADLDDDSDGSDFLVWQREHGSAGIPQPILAEVPEPASLALGMVAFVGGLNFRRRNRHKR